MNHADRTRRLQAAIDLVSNEFGSPSRGGAILQGYIDGLGTLRSQAGRTQRPWPEDLQQAHDAFIAAHDNFIRHLEDLLLDSVSDTAEDALDTARLRALVNAIRDFSKIYGSYYLDDDAVKLTTYSNKLQCLLALSSQPLQSPDTRRDRQANSSR